MSPCMYLSFLVPWMQILLLKEIHRTIEVMVLSKRVRVQSYVDPLFSTYPQETVDSFLAHPTGYQQPANNVINSTCLNHNISYFQ
jgi:hypothetical protein